MPRVSAAGASASLRTIAGSQAMPASSSADRQTSAAPRNPTTRTTPLPPALLGGDEGEREAVVALGADGLDGGGGEPGVLRDQRGEAADALGTRVGVGRVG